MPQGFACHHALHSHAAQAHFILTPMCKRTVSDPIGDHRPIFHLSLYIVVIKTVKNFHCHSQLLIVANFFSYIVEFL